MTLPSRMTVIAIKAPGGPEMLVPEERPVPAPGPGEILVKVAAAGVNRPDVRQRQGTYPPPKGATDIPGLEIAGEVAALGPDVKRWKLGDKVCALVVGGAYAQYCLAYEAHALPVPPAFSMIEAAALPECFFTCWQNMFMRADVKPREATGGKGANLIVDIVGGDYVDRNYDAAAEQGVIAQVSFTGGPKATANFANLMRKRLTHTGSTLRPRTVAEKAEIAHGLEARVWPLIAAGKIKPVIDSTYPLAKACDAHARMETSQHIGKIVLTV